MSGLVRHRDPADFKYFPPLATRGTAPVVVAPALLALVCVAMLTFFSTTRHG